MTIKRRYFLFAVVAGLIGARFLISSDEKSIIAVLRKRLDYLRLDEEGLRAFAADLAAKHKIASSRLRWVSAAGFLYDHFNSFGSNALAHGVLHGEERIVTDYLLSSDFFVNGQDETRVVKYLGFFDPMKACANPFARRVG